MLTIWRSTMIVAAGALVFLVFTFAILRAPFDSVAPARTRPYKDALGIDHLTAVTILHFYATPGVLEEGEKASLCYGVAKAKVVRLEPAVEPLAPSLNRCIQVAPEQDTRYTLIAEGHDGLTASESFVIQVQPDPRLLPRVLYFAATKKDDPGQTLYSLCFGVENAVRVAVDPPVIPSMEGAPRGCFYVAPKQTTTYTLTALGRHERSARRKLTLQVPKS